MSNQRSEQGLNLRKFEVGHFGSWRLAAGLTIFLMVTKATGTSDSCYECCPGSEIRIDSQDCSDGSGLRLNCDGYQFYILDESNSPRDKFHIDHQSRTLIEIGHGNRSSPDHRFCVSGKNSTRHFAFVCFDHHLTIPQWKHTLDGVLMIISGIFSVLIFLIYFMLPGLRSIQDKSIMSMVIFQSLAYFVGSIGQLRTPSEGEDIINIPYVASYWLYMCSFFWMNLVCFNIWRSVWFKNFAINDKNLFRIFCAIVFVGPGLMVINSLVKDHTEHTGYNAQWVYFYGLPAVLMMLNVVYLTLTCWRLWIDNRAHTGGQLKSLRTDCLLCLKLAIVMAILWIFKVVTDYDPISGFRVDLWLIADIVNSLQGVIMFVLLVATRRRVKKLLTKKHPCGFNFPESWADYDENEENVVPVSHVNLEFSAGP